MDRNDEANGRFSKFCEGAEILIGQCNEKQTSLIVSASMRNTVAGAGGYKQVDWYDCLVIF